MSYLEVDGENVIVSAMKKAENEDGVVVRLYNLNEEREEKLELKNDVLQLTLGNQSIETVLLNQ